MTDNIYITASCNIAGNAVIKNGKTLFTGNGSHLQAFLQEAYQHFAINYPRFYKMDNLCKLGWLATEILLEASFTKTDYKPEEVGLVLSNRSSSLDTDIRYFETVKTIASPALFVYTLPNIVMGEICIRHQFKGENDFFIFDSFDAGFLQHYIAHLFATGALKACIGGWVEVAGNDYHASLFLAERRKNENAMVFTEENIHHLYQITNG